jgi:hypothetical protein
MTPVGMTQQLTPLAPSMAMFLEPLWSSNRRLLTETNSAM